MSERLWLGVKGKDQVESSHHKYCIYSIINQKYKHNIIMFNIDSQG